jgi:hypothetical protein
MANKLKRIGLIVLLGIMVIGLGIKADDNTSAGSSSDTVSPETDFTGFNEFISLAPEIAAFEQSPEFNQAIMSNGAPSIHIKADTKSSITFSAPNELKPTVHHLWWDNGALPDDPSFIDGYIKIVYNPAICQVSAVASGWLNAYIRVTGSNYVVIRLYKYGVLQNDPNATACTITFKGLQAGTTTLDYSATDRSGNYQGWIMAGGVHDIWRVPVVFEFLPALQPPNAPGNLVATAVSPHQIDLTWQDNSDNEVGFIIERKTGGYDAYGQIAILDEDVTTYSNTGLSDGSLYYYRVRAYNQAGNSEYSNDANAITPLPAPTNLVATAVSSHQINLTWQDNSDNEQVFYIERKLSCHDPFVQIATVNANLTNYSDIGLSPGTVYYYRICAHNEVINSAYSDKSAAVTFADITTAEEILTLINQYHQQGAFKNNGVYNSLSAKITNIKNAINQKNYQSALGQLKALTNELNALNETSITPEARNGLLTATQALNEYIYLRSSLPTTIDLYLSEELCVNELNIYPTAGEAVISVLTGTLTAKLESTANPDIISVTVTKSNYEGTPLIVNGIDFGTLYITNDQSNSSVGTLNLTTGQIEITHKVLVSSSYLDSLSLSPVPIEVTMKGVCFPLGLTNLTTNVLCEGTIPATVPLLGNAPIFMQGKAGTQLPTHPSCGGKVLSVEWVRKDSFLLVNPNSGGGLRIFPCKQTPNDKVNRRIVKVKATFDVPPEIVVANVYFKSFDVDDPSSDTLPIDNENYVVGNEKVDNKDLVNPIHGTFGAVEIEGEAKPPDVIRISERQLIIPLGKRRGTVIVIAEFEVTMQPGDNFRIAVGICSPMVLYGLYARHPDSVISTGQTYDVARIFKENDPIPMMTLFKIGGNETVFQQSPGSYDKMQTVMLTVWRLLHLEVDSMDAVPKKGSEKNFIAGTIDTIVCFIGASIKKATSVFTNPTPTCDGDSSPNFNDSLPGYGRFESGKVEIGTDRIKTDGLDGNGDLFISNNDDGINIPFLVSKKSFGTLSGYIMDMTRPWKKFVLNIQSGGDLTQDYVGGTINISGVEMTISTIFDKESLSVEEIKDISFELRDDDTATMPHRPLIDALVYEKYGDAYILPIVDGGGNTANNKDAVPFELNLDSSNGNVLLKKLDDTDALESDGNRADNYWIAYIMGCYQPHPYTTYKDAEGNVTWRGDNDPDSETSLEGIAVGKKGAFYFHEVMLDGQKENGWGETRRLTYEQRVVIHEIAHEFALPDRIKDSDTGLMSRHLWDWPGDDVIFNDDDIDILRTRPQSPGR